ncbi:MAG: phosphatase PAP2 family protein [Thermodesulfobacteriota bacterium]
MEIFLKIDETVFYALNNAISNPLFDFLVIILTKKYLLFLMLASVSAYAFWEGGKETRKALFLAALALVLSDVSAQVLKEVFARVRPCHALKHVKILAECAESFSFPSRHALDIFGVMTSLAIYFRKYAKAFLAIAAIVALSRVYAGVHYPADVAFGAALGVLAAYGVYNLDMRYSGAIEDKIKAFILKFRR